MKKIVAKIQPFRGEVCHTYKHKNGCKQHWYTNIYQTDQYTGTSICTYIEWTLGKYLSLNKVLWHIRFIIMPWYIILSFTRHFIQKNHFYQQHTRLEIDKSLATLKSEILRLVQLWVFFYFFCHSKSAQNEPESFCESLMILIFSKTWIATFCNVFSTTRHLYNIYVILSNNVHVYISIPGYVSNRYPS